MMNRSKYRNCLPQCLNRMFLTDGGLETTLIYHEGIELPCFAAFTLLKTEQGVGRLCAAAVDKDEVTVGTETAQVQRRDARGVVSK